MLSFDVGFLFPVAKASQLRGHPGMSLLSRCATCWYMVFHFSHYEFLNVTPHAIDFFIVGVHEGIFLSSKSSSLMPSMLAFFYRRFSSLVLVELCVLQNLGVLRHGRCFPVVIWFCID